MALDTKSFVPKELTPEELEVKSNEVLDKIVVARVGLLLRHPFFGNMATRLKIQSCDDWCPTAATDGRHLYYNTQFFNALSEKQIEFVIAHEILHCAFDHLTRREDRQPTLHNIACDYLVNNILVREGIGEKVTQIPIIQDFKYEGWSSEQVYDDLYENCEKINLADLGELLDEHIDWEDDGSDSKQGAKGKGEGKGKGKAPKYTKEELRKIKEEIKEGMMQAAQAAGAGNVPGEIDRMIKDLTEPKMNWREIIQQQIQSTIKNDYTFSRPSRKGLHVGAILPGMNFDETIPESTKDQFDIAMRDLDTCLIAAGSSSNDVVKVRVFLTDIRDRSIINPKRIEYFGEHKPASTLLEVSALVDPRMKVEIEAEAIVTKLQ